MCSICTIHIHNNYDIDILYINNIINIIMYIYIYVCMQL